MGEEPKGPHAEEARESLAATLRRLKGGTLMKRIEGKREGAKIPSKPFDRPGTEKG